MGVSRLRRLTCLWCALAFLLSGAVFVRSGLRGAKALAGSSSAKSFHVVAPCSDLPGPYFRRGRYVLDFKLVVAHYNENLTWLAPFASASVVYSKGQPPSPPEDPRREGGQVLRLPNIGREAHSFLTYIIDHYDSLPTMVLFSQGSPSHAKLENFFVLDMCGFRHDYEADWGLGDVRWSWRLQSWKGYDLAPANGTFGDFWDQFIRRQRPKEVRWFPGSTLSVRRERILLRQKYEYVELRRALGNHNNPELAHYIERSWRYLFS